jgi:hypothetical protein
VFLSAVSKKRRLPLVFIDTGVKINGEYYKMEVFEKYLLPAVQTYRKDYFSFQQDGALSYTALNSGATKHYQILLQIPTWPDFKKFM